MKKVIITMLTIILSINFVYAEEYLEITNDIEVRYRWYKEVASDTGEYVPLKDIKETDIIDNNNTKYVGSSAYSEANCTLPSEYYLLKANYTREYYKVYNVSYVLIENFEYDSNVIIYYNNKPILFNVISAENNQVKINLRQASMPEKLLFFIENDTDYTISLYRDENFEKQMLSANIKNQRIVIPDKTWINKNTVYHTYTTSNVYAESDFTKIISERKLCSYQEKYVYKYETIKEYYDDNYYLNIDGYIKDDNDYKIYYKGKPIVNTIEIINEKIIEVPKTEYVYVETKTQENDSSQETQCQEKTITKTQTEYVEQEVPIIPQYVYIILFILLIIIVLLIIRICKKHVD